MQATVKQKRVFSAVASKIITAAPYLLPVRQFLFFYYAEPNLPVSYIIPPIPPPAGIAGASSLIFATTDSVVRRVDATLVAF